MADKPALFIVLYGINNLGKSTQAKLLVEKMIAAGHRAIYLKYPIYDLSPSGKMLNAYLREGNPYQLTPREVQTLYALNRTQYQTTLRQHLADGTHVVAEDYTGTGLAWGLGAGVNEHYLQEINSHLDQEDLAFLFVGERFTEATEKNHKHETNDTLLTAVELAHQKLGQDLGWLKIKANNTITEIHQELWNEVQKHIVTTGLEK